MSDQPDPQHPTENNGSTGDTAGREGRSKDNDAAFSVGDLLTTADKLFGDAFACERVRLQGVLLEEVVRTTFKARTATKPAPAEPAGANRQDSHDGYRTTQRPTGPAEAVKDIVEGLSTAFRGVEHLIPRPAPRTTRPTADTDKGTDKGHEATGRGADAWAQATDSPTGTTTDTSTATSNDTGRGTEASSTSAAAKPEAHTTPADDSISEGVELPVYAIDYRLFGRTIRVTNGRTQVTGVVTMCNLTAGAATFTFTDETGEGEETLTFPLAATYCILR